MIYLDSAASYPLLNEVKAALNGAFENIYANSSSSHQLGAIVNEEVDNVRSKIADAIGAYPSEIIFTSGATESNNIAFKSLLLGGDFGKEKKHIVTSQIEHKCIFAISDYLKTLGYEFTFVKPNLKGIITAESVREVMRPETALVSVMHVNNELGTINPIAEIGKECFENQVLFHTDAAQSFQKLDIDVDEMNIDLMSFSAHKIGGPKGIGAIYIRELRKRQLMPVIHGAGQEEGLRGGTVAAPLVMGFGAAVMHFKDYYDAFSRLAVKESFLKSLDEKSIKYRLNGGHNTLPSCISLTFPEINIPLLIRDNEDTFCLAQGSACSSKEIEASHVLTALGLSREEAEKTLRISFPLDVTESSIEELASKLSFYPA
jgi:cysteine desulfurase